MTSISGSPAPKPRPGRGNHRQTKSSSSISAPNQPNTKYNTQQPNIHFHNNHQLPPNPISGNRGPSRSPAGVMTPPQTPKAQQFSNADVSGKRRRSKKQDKAGREKSKARDITAQILAAIPSVPIPVDIESPPTSSDELASGQITPPKMSSTPPSKAYAGPTFHSSPAPSALPMPKFFSKSVPGTPASNSLQTMMEGGATASTSVGLEQEQSHLELLFRAARAENMGMKRQSSGSTSSSESTLESSSATFGPDPESPIRSNRRISRNIPHESGLFSMDELDKPLSPTFKERINQARSTTAPSGMPTQASLGEEERRKIETANALKQFLLAPHSPARKTPVSSPSPAPRAQNRSSRVYNRPPPPLLFKASPPLSPTQNTYQTRSPLSPSGTGYFPLFSSSAVPFPYEQQPSPYTISMTHGTTPLKGPGSYRASFQSHPNPAEGRSERIISTYMAPQPLQFSGAGHNRTYHNHNSILASKLEAAKVTPAKSVTDLENDLRRVLMI